MGGKAKATRSLITRFIPQVPSYSKAQHMCAAHILWSTNTKYNGMNQGQKQQQEQVSFRFKWDLLAFSGLYYAIEANQIQLLAARNKDSKSVMKM